MRLYQKCYLQHIPAKLHRKGRKLFKKFFLNEQVYRRCDLNEIELPFAKANIYDISVNRQGKPSKPLCVSEDVMFNIAEKTGLNVPKYQGAFIVLVIKKLLKNKTYKKVFRNGQDTVTMFLKHDPVPCNYAHSVFEIVLNGEVVTKNNYELFKKNKYKFLRKECRLELHKIIIRREIKV